MTMTDSESDGGAANGQSGEGKTRASVSMVPSISFKVSGQPSVRVPVPQIKPVSGDRRGRREAKEATRELARASLVATKTGVAMQAVNAVNVYALYTFDKTQQEMMEILFGRDRYDGENESVSGMAQLLLQLSKSQIGAFAENHGRRQLELL